MKLQALTFPNPFIRLLPAVFTCAALASACGGSSEDRGDNGLEIPQVNVASEVAVDPSQAGMFEQSNATPIGDMSTPDSVDLTGELIPLIFDTETGVSQQYAQSGAALIQQINESLWLPENINVMFADCGTANAFFIRATLPGTPDDSGNTDDTAIASGGNIVMCHELTGLFFDFFGNEKQAFRASTFVLMHELGHALVEVLSLPVLGIEESYVDGIAAVFLGESNLAEGALLAGWFFGSQTGTPFFDTHRAGPQRLGDLACWAVGADSSLREDPLTDSIATQLLEGGRNCRFEYQQQVNGLNAVLGPNIRGGLSILAQDR